MRGVALLLLSALVPVVAAAEPATREEPAREDLARLELNVTETVKDRCQITFLIENKTPRTIESLKLDLAVFNPEGVIQRRMIAEMGPVGGKRTNVRTFSTEGECSQIGSILVNDVTACSPGEAPACMDGLALSSKVKNVRLYK
jgi:hypothetical protein